MRLVLALLTTLLIVLSGCNGIFVGDPLPEPTPTLEPTPTPRLPSGIADDDIHEEKLLSAHVQMLQNTSYTMKRGGMIRYLNGTLFSEYNQTVRVDDDELLIADSSIRSNDSQQYQSRSNGSVRFVKQWSGNETTYQQEQRLIQVPLHRNQLSDVFAAIKMKVTGRTTDGGVRYHVIGVHFQENRHLGSSSSDSDMEFTATIDGNGVVQRYNLSYTGTIDGKQVRISEYFRIHDIGTTTVERPNWVDEAKAKTN